MTKEEEDDPSHIDMRRRFDESIASVLGPGALISDFDPENLTPEFPPYEDVKERDGDDDDLTPEEVTPEMGDSYLNAEISVSKGGSMARGRVTGRKRDADGNPMGRSDPNPILDTRVYEVKFDDGDVTALTANMIAQAMFAQCDSDGNQYMLLDQLVDHRKTKAAISVADQIVHRSSGRTYQRRTTAGWQICCQ